MIVRLFMIDLGLFKLLFYDTVIKWLIFRMLSNIFSFAA